MAAGLVHGNVSRHVAQEVRSQTAILQSSVHTLEVIALRPVHSMHTSRYLYSVKLSLNRDPATDRQVRDMPEILL